MFLILKYNKIIFFGLALIFLFLMMAQAGSAAYDSNNPAGSTGLNETANQGYLGKSGSAEPKGIPTDIPLTIGKIIGAGLALLGVIFFVIIVYAGISWMMAMGKEEKINEAKDMIVAAILGLVVVLAAYAVTALVGGIFAN